MPHNKGDTINNEPLPEDESPWIQVERRKNASRSSLVKKEEIAIAKLEEQAAQSAASSSKPRLPASPKSCRFYFHIICKEAENCRFSHEGTPSPNQNWKGKQ
eukprot:11296181-Heterocapsa_arctica.AAC.1